MQPKKAHFIGISGKGMSAAAILLQESGWTISGSDEGFYPPVSDYLKDSGIPFISGYNKENIPANVDMIVIGKNAKLVQESNEEVAAAFAWQKGLPASRRVVSFPDVLSDLTEHTDNIVVAGSYGKSTCTALLSWCLLQSGKDPSFFIGEITKGLSAHARLGKGGTFILEGDEYPSANWDASAKFLHYHPKNVLLTSATHDHINVYKTHEDYLAPFKKLLKILPKDGLLMVNHGEPYALELSKDYTGTAITYGMNSKATWHPDKIVYNMPTTFNLKRGAKKIVSLSTTLLGAHNIENIVAVSALLLEKELLTVEQLATGIASFEGVKRRMELLSPNSAVPVLEGFGSSYEKARSAMEAMKLHFPKRRLVVVFEPHTFTWRNKAALFQYDNVFAEADKVYIYEPASQGAATHEQLTQDEIVERVRATGVATEPIQDPIAALETISKDLLVNDCVLLLTSGELGGLIKTLPAYVEQKFPN